MKNLRSIPRPRSYRAQPPLRHDTVSTPRGPVSFATDGCEVRRIRLGHALRDGGRPTALDRETARQLKQYFAGRRIEFELPFSLEATPFTESVLRAVARIPLGETRSYGEIAAVVGNPRAARAVGRAVGSNRLPLIIPCHRVLASDGGLGGFGGGLAWKRFLLHLEGVSWKQATPA